ncbi:MAG: ABC transporter permease [Planctomycetes bacterium]|nr:ABC transporter permease [Planctomycetota bacterium]
MRLPAALDWRSWAVVRRNARVYFRTWHIGLLPPALEPVVFLLAFGFGLGGYVAGVPWRGEQLPYIVYIAPGLVAYTTFTTPYFQGLYAAYVRMHYQKTWDGLLTTQVELEHVLWGEILWAGLLGALFATIVTVVLLVCHCFGILTLTWTAAALIPPLAFLAGCAFASLALVFTAIVPSIDHMNLPAFLVGIPVAVISDTYFPMTSEHPVIIAIVACNPVHHVAETFRSLLVLGHPGANLVGLLATTGALLGVCAPLALHLLRRRVLGER